ncbi:hypothetical protein OG372_30435 [Streptomyces sp. NBC_01020]|uniref:hypothetical protein n=1 Tax=unclassified Streptomyces TaxID=2593676 RepID=UPI00224F56E6|nr:MULTISPECIES: hypothetical protein [unclassified Streptomyces]MCX4722810.1 hypothetical protein [Streptomyces sp. NBC_01306]WSV07527.1 hypothetical protein OG372_30435 [Streptomyces sp. NBC_01020]WSX66306.1 hypothetical protein OG221_06550 [Streptomyces sp. NBC_00932]
MNITLIVAAVPACAVTTIAALAIVGPAALRQRALAVLTILLHSPAGPEQLPDHPDTPPPGGVDPASNDSAR